MPLGSFPSTRAAKRARLAAQKLYPFSKGEPGDIAAISKIEEIHFNAVLHDDAIYFRTAAGSRSKTAPLIRETTISRNRASFASTSFASRSAMSLFA